MPMYARDDHFPVAEDIAARGLSLPSYPTLSQEDLERVAAALRGALETLG
jgi:perosamine synthetase